MITHTTAAKNAATDAIVDLLDVGAGSNGTLELIDSSGPTTLATFDLGDPAFGSASSGTATANAISNATAGASGTADKYEAKDADGNLVWSGEVGESTSITGVDTGANTVDVGTDLTGDVEPGDLIRISGSTGNDGVYTVDDITSTTITTVESITDATADGNVKAYDLTIDNTSINSGQDVAINSWTYTALHE